MKEKLVVKRNHAVVKKIIRRTWQNGYLVIILLLININQWKDHDSSLLNSSSNTADKDDVCKSFNNMCFNQGMYVSVTEVMELLRELSSGKASGMDGLTGESLKYANHILPVLLSICFTCMFKHCYLLISMLDSVIVPLVKNRNGDLTDKNN